MDSAGWDERYAATDLVWSATPNRWVAEVTEDLPPGRVIDLAGGEGRNALWLAERGWQATLVDFSEVALGKARTLAEHRFGADDQRLSILTADLVNYRPPWQSFDLVLVIYLHLPAEQRRTVLRSAAAAVAPGGLLVVVAHDSANIGQGTGGPQDPAVVYTAAEAADDVADTGLIVQRAELVRRPVDTDEGARDALDALLLARRPELSQSHSEHAGH